MTDKEKYIENMLEKIDNSIKDKGYYLVSMFNRYINYFDDIRKTNKYNITYLEPTPMKIPNEMFDGYYFDCGIVGRAFDDALWNNKWKITLK